MIKMLRLRTKTRCRTCLITLIDQTKCLLALYLQVLKILAWDTKNHLVYYLGTLDKKPGQQHLYIVKDPLNKDNAK